MGYQGGEEGGGSDNRQAGMCAVLSLFPINQPTPNNKIPSELVLFKGRGLFLLGEGIYNSSRGEQKGQKTGSGLKTLLVPKFAACNLVE